MRHPSHFSSACVLALFVSYFSLAMFWPYSGTILENSDDGTEVNDSIWYQDGYQSSLNYLGRRNTSKFDVGFRFHVGNLMQAERIAYARLRLASFGSDIQSSLHLFIEGVLQPSATAFSTDERPSQKVPKTKNKVDWTIQESWKEGQPDVPLYYSSPDISQVINEIIALPNWGLGAAGKTLIINLEENGSSEEQTNLVYFDDFESSTKVTTPAVLEIYRTVYDTFIGKEHLGVVSDSSATINLYSLIDTDLYVQYGTTPGILIDQTQPLSDLRGETPIEISLDGLKADTRYYYRLVFRQAGEGKFETGEIRTFHTQRSKGSSFSFAIIADEHLQNMYRYPHKEDRMELYWITLGLPLSHKYFAARSW